MLEHSCMIQNLLASELSLVLILVLGEEVIAVCAFWKTLLYDPDVEAGL